MSTVGFREMWRVSAFFFVFFVFESCCYIDVGIARALFGYVCCLWWYGWLCWVLRMGYFVPPLGGTVGYRGVVPVGILGLFYSCLKRWWLNAAGVFFFVLVFRGYIFSK